MSPANRLTIPLFSCTLLLSAALMFAVQPMIGRMLLPKVGGAPAGWIVAVAFFQLCLLAGYLVAHVMSLQTPRRHGLIYLGLLALGAAFLPLQLGDISLSGDGVSFAVLSVLTMSIAVPFIAISATSSTLQRLFTATGHARASDPYFLYVASNIGSFAGLLGYPLLAEPLLGISDQTLLWAGGYVFLILMGLACLSLLPQSADDKRQKQQDTAPRADNRRRGLWVFLSFVPSCLMMATTTRVSTEIVSFPLLWVLPLAAYLLTFILAFSPGRRPHSQKWTMTFYIFFTILVASLLKLPVAEIFAGSWWSAVIHITAFGFIAYLCHARLADLRPVENATRDLTEFYLMMAVGGALGGALNAFVFPFIFNGPYEFALSLCLALLALPAAQDANKKKEVILPLSGIILLGVFAYAQQFHTYEFLVHKSAYQFLALGAIVSFLMLSTRLRFLLLAVTLAMPVLFDNGQVIAKERNFFGSSRVIQVEGKVKGEKVISRRLLHGTTLHGFQLQDDRWRLTPTSYYEKRGPLGDIMNAIKPWDVLAIGLGTGTLNCTVPPDSGLTFIDIDPGVVKIAQEHFSFLSGCPRKDPVRIMFGDGRLVLDKLHDKFYDLIVIDAFTSDAIPVHLLTVEAVEKFKSRLKTGGIIAFHISNRYFDLSKQLRRQTEELGMESRIRRYKPPRDGFGTASIWVAASEDSKSLDLLNALEWKTIDPDPNRRVWTDDYNNLLSTLYKLEKK
jgi:spermidine synthase